MSTDPVFFSTPALFRAWLKSNHHRRTELVVGFYKLSSGKPSITWPESVAEALCFGWIDGVRRARDDDSYSIRFTPRKMTSTWSAINIKLIAELEAAGRMTAAGRAAFAARRESRSAIYSFEQDNIAFDNASARRFKSNKSAWTFFQAQPPGYRKRLTWWIMSAKRPQTRESRLTQLIAASASAERIR